MSSGRVGQAFVLTWLRPAQEIGGGVTAGTGVNGLIHSFDFWIEKSSSFQLKEKLNTKQYAENLAAKLQN